MTRRSVVRDRRSRRASCRASSCSSTSAARSWPTTPRSRDSFATTFVHSGTYGFIPGEPSAWTQPGYSFFLIPVYWIFGRNWPAVGLLQIARRGGDGADRLRDRPAVPLAARGADRGRRRDAEPVPRLARRPRQPRDRRPGARGRDRLPDAARWRSGPSAASAAVAVALGVVLALGDPRQHAARSSCRSSAAAFSSGSGAAWAGAGARASARARSRCCRGRCGTTSRSAASRSRPTRRRSGRRTTRTRTPTLAAGQVDRRRARSSRRAADARSSPAPTTRRTPRADPVDECAQQSFYRTKALVVRRRPSRREGEARRARRCGCSGTRRRAEDGGPAGRGRLHRRAARRGCSRLYEIPLYLLAIWRAVPDAAADRAYSSCSCSATRPWSRSASPATRATGCRGTSLLALAAGVAVVHLWSWLTARRTAPADRRREGRARPPDPRASAGPSGTC